MTDVIFEDEEKRKREIMEQMSSGSEEKERKQSTLINIVVKHGVAKNELMAGVILIIFSLIVIGLSVYFMTRVAATNTPDTIYLEDLTPEERERIPDEFLKLIPSRHK